MATKTQHINLLTYSKVRTWQTNGMKGARPRSPYHMVSLELKSSFADERVFSTASQIPPEKLVNQAQNASYNKFKSSVMSGASVGASLAESRQSMSMIGNRLLQITAFASLLARRRFRDAYKALGQLQPPRRTRDQSKTLGNLFLEAHFGWSPLIKDIYDAVDVLQNPVKETVVRGRGGMSSSVTIVDPTFSQGYGSTETRTYKVFSQQIATVSVSNPNLLLANRLGLINPVSIAWELVPFSFLIDWFVTVGDFLSSFTDFVGLNIIEPATTLYCVSTVSEYTRWMDGETRTRFTTRVEVKRSLGLTLPKVLHRPSKPLSVARGLTAVSLLVQQLKGSEIPKQVKKSRRKATFDLDSLII